MERLLEELMRRKANPLFVQGIAQGIAVGVAAGCYHMNLRMDAAKRLLCETKRSMVAVALDVGYANPSHFAQLFRRETGLSPSDYRRQR